MPDLIISLCIPAMNRTSDLITVLPSIIEAANASTPVQILILDYGSQDDLEQAIQPFMNMLSAYNRMTYLKYDKRTYFHMAHARNLSVLASIGEYAVISSCDIRLNKDFFSSIREQIVQSSPVWINFNSEQGVLAIQRTEFIACGGFDERFEFYGSEDKDLFYRLFRRNGLPANIREKKFYAMATPNEVKVQNYRLKISKREMDERGKVFYYENLSNNVLKVNPNGWGSWD